MRAIGLLEDRAHWVVVGGAVITADPTCAGARGDSPPPFFFTNH